MVSFCSLPSFLLSFSSVCLLQFLNFIDAQAQAHYYPATATLPAQWMNYALDDHSFDYDDGSRVWPILFRSIDPTLACACGFYCNGNCNTYLFAVFFVTRQGDGSIYPRADGYPQVVWSANRDNPVKIGAVLELTSEGDFVLKDADGTVAWSKNTSIKSVVGLNLTHLGSLELFNNNNVTIWRSFDEPTDSLVRGQKLMPGQRLIPSVSETDWTASGTFTLSMNSDGFSAQMETSPPQIYLFIPIDNLNSSDESPYVGFNEFGGLAIFSNSTTIFRRLQAPSIFSASLVYMKVGSDGHLRRYEWAGSWNNGTDLLTGTIGKCGYPTACGPYGICAAGQCSCPSTSYFSPIDGTQPNLGCSENVPLSCGASQSHSFLPVEDVTYLVINSYLGNISALENANALENTNASSCKEACAKDCSCKAAMFYYRENPTNGSCYLPTQVFSLINTSKYETFITINTTVHLKVQKVANQTSINLRVILGSSLGALFAVMFLIVAIVLFVQKRDDNEAEEDYLDQVPGMPSRFTYNDLKAVTDDFSKKLGEGGFGSVFEGILIEGTKVAVKRLEGFGQVKKSFLAEVETIGSIHHINLVTLIGFCAEKFHRLLIYEYMSNGSLDKWIFRKSNECVLDWQQRKNIILDIARGLNYLHEDCRQKILHLDIKPQNILLDGNFNAKIADFGLSKLIDRDQSKVVTTMRGTPGYLAPEWWSAGITEKVDVYSFGVVILEIVCGRKIFDRSQDEEDMHLLGLFKRKAEEERMLDIVDVYSEDMQLNGPQAVNMLRVAAWCLQGDYTRRPSMSTVIKVLEGVSEVEVNLDYNFSAQPSTYGAAKFGQIEIEFGAATALLPSVLSGPR